jgi:hypothetical protein
LTRDLLQKWRCERPTCRNNKKYCYTPIGSDIHYHTDAHVIGEWARWILEQMSTLGLERHHLMQTMPVLLFEKVKKINEEKHQRSSSGRRHSNSSNSTPQLATSQPIYHPWAFPPLPLAWGSSQIPSPFSPWSTSHQNIGICSSPAASESDSEKEIDDYMDYLSRKHPTKREKYEQVAIQIKDQDMTLKQVHEMKEEGLRKEFDVTIGVAKDIIQGIKPWQRSKASLSSMVFNSNQI